MSSDRIKAERLELERVCFVLRSYGRIYPELQIELYKAVAIIENKVDLIDTLTKHFDDLENQLAEKSAKLKMYERLNVLRSIEMRHISVQWPCEKHKHLPVTIGVPPNDICPYCIVPTVVGSTNSVIEDNKE